jgi:hypothetical protein
MAAWIVCVLCALVIIKPQEFILAIGNLPLLYVTFGVAVVLVFFDIVNRRVRIALAPQVPFVIAFFLWGILTTALKTPDRLEIEATRLVIVLAVFGAIAFGAASTSGMRMMTATFLACALLVTGVGIKQGFSDFGCFTAEEEDWEGKGELTYDGRSCETVLDCRKDAPDPEANYRCERKGPLGTASIGGRVRYRGSLADPNELSLMVGMAIPFALAFAERGRRRRNDAEEEREEASRAAPSGSPLPLLVTDRLLARVAGVLRAIPVGAVLGAIGLVVVLSKSRTGVLVYLLVLGAYFIRRAGAWGIVGGSLVGPPMLLFGGRSGTEAEASSDERVELLREGFEMIRETKGVGIGLTQFSDESSLGLTAHNAYLLAAAETGLVGLVLFGLVMYYSLKVPYAIAFGRYRLDATLTKLAPAMAISLTGAALGIFFLSWAYKDALYMMLGASAALYSAARAQDRSVQIGITLKEIVLVSAGMFALLGVIYLGLRIH